MSTPGSNDPTGTSRKVSAWLHGAGTHPVSHFDFCGLADICRYGFDAAALTVESNDSISTVWRDSGWLRDVGTSQVSRFAFLRYFGIDALNPDLHRFDLQSSTSTPGSNDPMQTFRVVLGWLRYAGASAVSHFVILCLFVVDTLDLDLYRFNLDSSGSTARSIDLQATH